LPNIFRILAILFQKLAKTGGLEWLSYYNCMFKSVWLWTNQQWNILQLCQSKMPGQFILWLSIDFEIVSASMIRKTLYHLNPLKSP